MLLKESHSDPAAFWGGSCLAVDGRIYQYLATANHPFVGPDGRMTPDFRIVGSKLIYSPNNGHTWHNHGTSPVVSERWDKRSRENMADYRARRLIEFADFECPFCADFHKTLKLARATYPTQIAVSFVHYAAGAPLR